MMTVLNYVLVDECTSWLIVFFTVRVLLTALFVLVNYLFPETTLSTMYRCENLIYRKL